MNMMKLWCSLPCAPVQLDIVPTNIGAFFWLAAVPNYAHQPFPMVDLCNCARRPKFLMLNPPIDLCVKLIAWLVCADAKKVCVRICANQPLVQFHDHTRFSLQLQPVCTFSQLVGGRTCAHRPFFSVQVVFSTCEIL